MYILIEDELYKNSFTLTYLKCLGIEESELTMKEIHEGIIEITLEEERSPIKLYAKDYTRQQ